MNVFKIFVSILQRVCDLFTLNEQLIAQQLKYAEANVGVRDGCCVRWEGVVGRERTTREGLAQISWADTCLTRCWVAMETELGQGRVWCGGELRKLTLTGKMSVGRIPILPSLAYHNARSFEGEMRLMAAHVIQTYSLSRFMSKL